MCCLVKAVLVDPFNFDADPDPDPGSTLGKNGSGSKSGSRSFLKDLLNLLTKNNFLFYFFSLIFIQKLNHSK